MTAAGQGSTPTLEEVAAAAGVSRSTASRVVNRSPRVSPDARARVEAAIAELGYVPNQAARSLVTRRTDSIAVVVSEPEDRLFSDPFFAGVVRGVSRVLARHELQLVLMLEPAPGAAERIEHFATAGHVDGVLLLSLHGADPLPGRLRAAGVPVVVGGRPADPDISHVDADNLGGARTGVAHLLTVGARRIATITGPLDMPVGQDRLDGWRLAHEDAGLTPDEDLVATADFTEDGGEQAMVELLATAPDLDAVFAASDLMAVGALRALRAAGRAVPGDVRLLGFDDSAVARSSDPPLTTMRQPVTQFGEELARLLLAELDGGGGPARSVRLPTELVVRSSTGG